MTTNSIGFIIDEEKKEMKIYIQSKKEFVFTVRDLLLLLKGNKNISNYDITSISFEKVDKINKDISGYDVVSMSLKANTID